MSFVQIPGGAAAVGGTSIVPAGLVMDLDPNGAVPPRPPDSERLIFAAFAVPRVRGVWKLDVLRADGKALDRTKREGGWGSVSQVMRKHAGGEWTARRVCRFDRVRRD